MESSDFYFLLMISMLGLFFYLITYVLGRKNLNRKNSPWSVVFIFNLFLGVYLSFFIQQSILKKLNIGTGVLLALTAVMTLGILIHHLAILLEKRGSNSRFLSMIHHEISHTLICVPSSITSISISIAMMQNFTGMVGIYLTVTYSVFSVSTSLVGMLAGFRKIKLGY